MLEFMTMAALLVAGTAGGAAIAIGCMLIWPRKQTPDLWVVIEDWDDLACAVFDTRAEAVAYIDNAKAVGDADAHAWVVRGVVLLREEGDPR